MGQTITRVATDVGGTFTDLVSFVMDSTTGESCIVTAKSDTTPPNFELGVLKVIEKAGIEPSSIDFLAHGTTVVINALTQRKGACVGLITTSGFRDSLEIARGNRPDYFNLHYKKPPPFVPRYLRCELDERVDYHGVERKPLDLAPLTGILNHFRKEGVDAIAICYLHSYANPSHEQQTLDAIAKLWPDVSIVASHQITREWREYERTNTTVLSAYVQPIAERYLHRLDDGLRGLGFSGSPYIMQSNCGVDSLDAVSKIPITMVESGPASGFWGAAELGKLIEEPNVLGLDIGGTTAKCSLIEDGKVKIVNDYWIGRDRKSSGYPIMAPVVDLVEIGNGGGSIAWVDDFDNLHVGPQSAGALPGPAAYGKGGSEATATDANLLLGRINPEYFCGGEVKADMTSAEASIKRIGKRLGLDVNETAQGIIRIANNNMVNALKLVSLNRGFDPRDFTLVAFGGGGGMHAVALAIELGVKKVVIPANAAVFSAWGMILADLRRDYFITRLAELNDDAAEILENICSTTEKEAREQFVAEGFDARDVAFTRYAKFRYQNQEHTTEVLIDSEVTSGKLGQIAEDFHNAYEREYTYRLDTPIELVGIHLVAAAQAGKLEMSQQVLGDADASVARKGTRTVDYALDGKHEADIYDGEELRPGMCFAGPAVIEDSGATTVVHPDCSVAVDGFGNIHIDLPK